MSNRSAKLLHGDGWGLRGSRRVAPQNGFGAPDDRPVVTVDLEATDRSIVAGEGVGFAAVVSERAFTHEQSLVGRGGARGAAEGPDQFPRLARIMAVVQVGEVFLPGRVFGVAGEPGSFDASVEPLLTPMMHFVPEAVAALDGSFSFLGKPGLGLSLKPDFAYVFVRLLQDDLIEAKDAFVNRQAGLREVAEGFLGGGAEALPVGALLAPNHAARSLVLDGSRVEPDDDRQVIRPRSSSTLQSAFSAQPGGAAVTSGVLRPAVALFTRVWEPSFRKHMLWEVLQSTRESPRASGGWEPSHSGECALTSPKTIVLLSVGTQFHSEAGTGSSQERSGAAYRLTALSQERLEIWMSTCRTSTGAE
ncbi:hypothetical protein BOX15_Mlig010656g1 [Macrostomum lignano]|uniref:Uncharacterized protein n=1 Tax=Macrostomum lignano TaxID=282301 RepID=A0A267EKS7_9PLAT|nr:hypothetical protein BOX15_Mlig010656g1 [Macrostomum lignano]